MGKHAILGKIETAIEALAKKSDMDYAAVDIDVFEGRTQVTFHYSGYPASSVDPGDPGGSETYVFKKTLVSGTEDGPGGEIKHDKLLDVLWNGHSVDEKDIDEDFEAFVRKDVVPILDRHFTSELY